MKEHEKPWNPLTIDEVSALFVNAPFPWWIAGGFALELAVGHEIREHSGMTANGVRYLAPHIQLYYKSKNPRKKDEVDFEAVLNGGTQMDTGWLRKAISHSHGRQHPWLERLGE